MERGMCQLALQRLKGFMISTYSDTALGGRKKYGTPARSGVPRGNCPVASMSRVLKQFSSPAHCDCVHCGTLLELVSQRICISATTASTVTELVTSSLQLPSQYS